MSRIGNQPIPVPTGVDFKQTDGAITVKGPKGTLDLKLVAHISANLEGDTITISRASENRVARANHGLMRSLIANMVVGVSTGFQKKLKIIGMGYRADVRGSQLVMQLGYSHPIEYTIPSGITIEVDKQNNVTVSGIDKQAVGQVAAELRAYRKPDHYKGKGVRYTDEYIRIKAGKSA
jgi:large subunit ribosomal protein L6